MGKLEKTKKKLKKIMTAETARKLAENVFHLDEDKLNQISKQIYCLIENKAKLGSFLTYFKLNKSEAYNLNPIIEKLEFDGYKCKFIDLKSQGFFLEISWYNEKEKFTWKTEKVDPDWEEILKKDIYWKIGKDNSDWEEIKW